VPVSNGLVLVLVLTLADPDPAAFRSDHVKISINEVYILSRVSLLNKTLSV